MNCHDHVAMNPAEINASQVLRHLVGRAWYIRAAIRLQAKKTNAVTVTYHLPGASNGYIEGRILPAVQPAALSKAWHLCS
jgi:hypothetical protein